MVIYFNLIAWFFKENPFMYIIVTNSIIGKVLEGLRRSQKQHVSVEVDHVVHLSYDDSSYSNIRKSGY